MDKAKTFLFNVIYSIFLLAYIFLGLLILLQSH